MVNPNNKNSTENKSSSAPVAATALEVKPVENKTNPDMKATPEVTPNPVVKPKKNPTVQEVIMENKKGNYVDTAAIAKTPEERAKIEANTEMMKITLDSSGNWLWRRSDKLTDDDKAKRLQLVRLIGQGLSKQKIIEAIRKEAFEATQK